MQILKNLDLGEFSYARYELHSNYLKKDLNFGILRPKFAKIIAGSVYFIHGGNGDDEQFILADLLSTLSRETRDLLQNKNLQIVLPGIELSFLKENQLNPTDSFSDYFFKELIPAAEKGTQTTSSTRTLTGASMGGHAALNSFLRNPGFFSGVGAIFPCIVDINPYSKQECQSYLERTGINAQSFDILLNCFKATFKNETEYWSHDPVSLLKALPRESLSHKKIYLDVGTKDDFGLFVGTQSLSQALFEKDIPHHFELIENGVHDMNYLKSRMNPLFDFLLRLPQ